MNYLPKLIVHVLDANVSIDLAWHLQRVAALNIAICTSSSVLPVSSTSPCTPIDFNPSKSVQLDAIPASVSWDEAIYCPLHRYVTAMHATTSIRASPYP